MTMRPPQLAYVINIKYIWLDHPAWPDEVYHTICQNSLVQWRRSTTTVTNMMF